MNRYWLFPIVRFGAPVFGVIGGVGYFLLILYPNHIDYIQLAYFNKISIITLASLIAGTLCGILSFYFSRAISGFRAKGVLGLWVPLIFLVATFATPRLYFKSVLTAQNICLNNVREIEATKADWAQINNATNGTEVTWNDIAPYFTNGFPKCPEGGTYTLGRVGEPVLCSIPSHRLQSQK